MRYSDKCSGLPVHAYQSNALFENALLKSLFSPAFSGLARGFVMRRLVPALVFLACVANPAAQAFWPFSSKPQASAVSANKAPEDASEATTQPEPSLESDGLTLPAAAEPERSPLEKTALLEPPAPNLIETECDPIKAKIQKEFARSFLVRPIMRPYRAMLVSRHRKCLRKAHTQIFNYLQAQGQ
ncbi:MAG: hypothetical protein VKJ06_05495 [Vampirovibrionales bacterium]|nr:hypothetical protein [Vampirovibrionales bacterium]